MVMLICGRRLSGIWLGVLGVAALFGGCVERLSAAQARETGESDELFTGNRIPHLRIEISPEGMEVLRHYQFDINDLMERSNVLATVREGAMTYTNVAVHLKGHLGSFQPLDS